MEKPNDYSSMIEELEDLNNSSMFRRYMKLLFRNANQNDPAFDDLTKYCQEGGCEDLGIYMLYKYGDIELVNIDYMHIVIKKDNLYYDSITAKGVSSVYELDFFKDAIKGSLDDKQVIEDISNIPPWYREYFQELKENV